MTLNTNPINLKRLKFAARLTKACLLGSVLFLFGCAKEGAVLPIKVSSTDLPVTTSAGTSAQTTSGSASTAATTAPAAPYEIITFGDAIIAGVVPGQFQSVLSDSLKVRYAKKQYTIDNAGTNSGTTTSTVTVIDSVLNAHPAASAIYIQVGDNDVKNNLKQDTSLISKYVQNTDVLIAKAKSKKLTVYVSNVLPYCIWNKTWAAYNTFIQSYNTKLAAVCTKENVVFINTSYNIFVANPGYYATSDFMHPGLTGYQSLVHEFLKVFKN